jgi:hypothetical protein
MSADATAARAASEHDLDGAGTRERGPATQRTRWLALLVVLVTAVVYAATAGLPYFSETYMHLVAARDIGSIRDIFDPARVPLRPFQHAWFWGLEELWPVSPPLARLPGFAAHLASAAMVAALARRLGAEHRTAGLAAVAFALYPNVKSLVYVAAVGWPFRVLAMLAGLTALLDHGERPRARTGALVLAAFLFGLACHQGSLVFPALGGLLLLGRFGHDARRLARDPWLLSCGALAAAYALYVGFLQERDVHTLMKGGSVVANAARAALSLAPESLRVPVIEALRAGGTPVLLGVGAMGLLGAVVAVWIVRARAPVRALLLCLPFEWALAIAVTGFVQRHAYLASALFAIAVAMTWQRAQRTCRPIIGGVALLLVLGWAVDTAVDVRDLRAAGAVYSVLEAATEARGRAAQAETITLLDPPQQMGSESDLLVFDYGLQEALDLRGVAGPWEVVVTVGPWWRPGVVREPRERILARLRSSSRTYVAFDPWTGNVQEAK